MLKIHLHTFVISKIIPEVIPQTPYKKERGGEGEGKIENGRNGEENRTRLRQGREWRGRGEVRGEERGTTKCRPWSCNISGGDQTKKIFRTPNTYCI